MHLSGESLPEAWREPLVLRVKGDADRLVEAERAASMQDWLADRGYPLPRVLAVFAPGWSIGLPGDAGMVIDWTDAGLGDRHGDIVRTVMLFDFAWIATTKPLEQLVLRIAGPLLGRSYRRHLGLVSELHHRFEVVMDEAEATVY